MRPLPRCAATELEIGAVCALCSLPSAVCHVSGAGDEEAPKDIVQLPTMTITDIALLPKPEPWRIANMPGYEILSAVSDSDAKRTMNDFLRFHQAIEIVFPAIFPYAQIHGSIILCKNQEQMEAFMPKAHQRGAVSFDLKDRETEAWVVNLGFRPDSGNVLFTHWAGRRRPPPDVPRFGVLCVGKAGSKYPRMAQGRDCRAVPRNLAFIADTDQIRKTRRHEPSLHRTSPSGGEFSPGVPSPPWTSPEPSTSSLPGILS